MITFMLVVAVTLSGDIALIPKGEFKTKAECEKIRLKADTYLRSVAGDEGARWGTSCIQIKPDTSKRI